MKFEIADVSVDLAMPAETRKNEIFGGIQYVVKFANGYGASVVNHAYSRGVELAVIEFNASGDYELTYDIFDDVLGHLDADTLAETLVYIANLPTIYFK